MRMEGLGEYDLIGPWTRHLLACSVVPQPTMLPLKKLILASTCENIEIKS
jgi:hypothetical protein